MITKSGNVYGWCALLCHAYDYIYTMTICISLFPTHSSVIYNDKNNCWRNALLAFWSPLNYNCDVVGRWADTLPHRCELLYLLYLNEL